jgi:hypothetical protein
MLCGHPIKTQKGSFPCGKCPSCKINRRRRLTARLILETLSHNHTSFITLTYNDANASYAGNRPTLVKRDLDLFLHRVRKHKSIPPFRYYACGEYGEGETERPHYHALLFGLSSHETEQAVADAWTLRGNSYGFTDCKPVHPAHPAYVARYTTKKISAEKEAEWLGGRQKEFNRRSRWPGLGEPAVPRLANAYNTPAGEQYLIDNQDIIPTFVHSGKTWPLDEFMKTKIREHIGIPKREKSIHWEHFDDTGSTLWLDEGPDRDAKRQSITEQKQKLATIKSDRIASAPPRHGVL